MSHQAQEAVIQTVISDEEVRKRVKKDDVICTDYIEDALNDEVTRIKDELFKDYDFDDDRDNEISNIILKCICEELNR